MNSRAVGALVIAHASLFVLTLTPAKCSEAEPPSLEAIVDEAIVHFSRGESDAGQRAIKQAIETHANHPDGIRPLVLSDIAKRLCEGCCYREGAELFRQSAVAYGTYRDEDDRASALASLGEAYMAHGDYELALAAYPLAIEAINSPRAVEIDDRRAKSQNIMQPGRPTRIPNIRYRNIGGTRIPMITYTEIPGVMRRMYSVENNPIKAFYAADRKRFTGECRRRMANGLAELGQFDGASQQAALAAAAYKELNDPFEQARSLLMLAAMGRLAGRYEAAEENLTESFKLFRDVRLRQGDTLAPGEVQSIRQLFSYPHRELPAQELLGIKKSTMKMVTAGKDAKDDNSEEKKEDPRKGGTTDPKATVGKAIRSATGMDAFWSSTQARLDAISTYESRTDGTKYYVVRFVRPIDPWQGEADSHAEWAALSIGREKYDKAFDSAKKAIDLHQAIGDDGALVNDLGLASLAALKLDKLQESKRLANEQLALAKRAGRTDSVWKAQLNLARCLRREGQRDAAYDLLKQASAAVEQLRAAASRDAFRIGVFESRVTIYDEMLSLLIEMGESTGTSHRRNIEAWETAEKARARVLLEAMLSVRGGSSVQSQPREPLLIERRQTQQRIGELETELRRSTRDVKEGQPISDAMVQIERQLKDLRSQLTGVEQKLLAGFVIGDRNRFVNSVTYNELRAAKSIPSNTAILAYWLGSDRSFLWVLDDDAIHTVVLPPRNEIERIADSLIEQLVGYPTSPSEYSVERFDRVSYELYEAIVAPAARWLQDIDRLIVVPDGQLHSVPFSALAMRPASDTTAAPRLVDRYAVATTPSISVFHKLTQRRKSRPSTATKRVAVFADPAIENDGESEEQINSPSRPYFAPLPMTRKVAEQLRLAHGNDAEVFLADAANESAAIRCLAKDYRFIYFGTHGLLNMQSPDLSGLMLAKDASQEDDGFLRLSELAEVRIKTPLITLAACETGLGKHRRGEGVMAFQRELLAAGAENVVVSLWKVADASSAALTTRFFSNLADDGRNVAAAMRSAQLALRAHEEERFDPRAAADAIRRGESPVKVTVRPYEHPFHWAAFVVAGAGS